MESASVTPYQQQLNGSFTSLLRWPEFDAFWQRLQREDNQNWYLYTLAETPPQQVLTEQEFVQRLDQLAQWLKRHHQESYCGIVYVDNKLAPTFIKIYDPNNLGVVCGIGREPIPPAYIISKTRPIDSAEAARQTTQTAPWWRRILGRQA